MSCSLRRSSPSTLCKVCGAPGAGWHYGGLVCRSCRVFFFRAVQTKKPLTCKHNSSCMKTIGGPPGRASCGACRFIRCIQANMDISIVGDRIRKAESEEGTSQPSTSQSTVQQTSSQLALQLIALEMSVNRIDISNALNNNFPSLERSRQYYSWMARSYLSNSTFCPQMASLSNNIRNVLMEENLPLFSLLSQKYYSWLSRRLPSYMGPRELQDPIEALFENNNVSNSQFIILKVLSLLSPVMALSSEDKWAIFLVHNYCISLLFRIVQEEKLQQTLEHVTRLLGILQKLKALQPSGNI